MDLARLKEVVSREIIEKIDHRNLNLDVDFMHNVIPTTENLAVGIWKILVKAIAPAQLVLIRLWESENNRVEYAGE
jgi:6-pyruvoyltetrahydropterin/6-carboxytetrahydropterin synthase